MTAGRMTRGVGLPLPLGAASAGFIGGAHHFMVEALHLPPATGVA